MKSMTSFWFSFLCRQSVFLSLVALRTFFLSLEFWGLLQCVRSAVWFIFLQFQLFSTIRWKDDPFSIELPLLHCQRSVRVYFWVPYSTHYSTSIDVSYFQFALQESFTNIYSTSTLFHIYLFSTSSSILNVICLLKFFQSTELSPSPTIFFPLMKCLLPFNITGCIFF